MTGTEHSGTGPSWSLVPWCQGSSNDRKNSLCLVSTHWEPESLPQASPEYDPHTQLVTWALLQHIDLPKVMAG